MARIFISHSNANNNAAIRIRDWLVREGWKDVFLDLDRTGLAPGQRWQEELRRAGEECAAIVVLVSPAWAASKWCLAEFLLAVQLGKKILPVIVEPTPLQDLPAELIAHFQLADISDPKSESEGFERLLIGLKRAGLDPLHFAWPPERDKTRSPYRGLEALEEVDAGVFFGRDTLITKGLDALRRMREGSRERALVILGVSGSGKSSFLKAGLLARLHRDDFNFLPLPVVRPGDRVLTGSNGFIAALTAAMASAKLQSAPRETLVNPEAVSSAFDALRAPVMDRVKRASEAAGEGFDMRPPAIVVAVDQGEELFSGDASETQTFFQLLTALLARDANLIVIIATRLEAYANFQEQPSFSPALHLPFSLPPLSPTAFREVITGPAKLARPPLEIDPELPDQLIADLGVSDSLPLLAATLERLHLRCRTEGRITLRDYIEGLGGVAGTISRAAEAALNAVMAKPNCPKDMEGALKLARETFVPALVAIDLETSQPKRRQAALSKLSPSGRTLIRCFVDERLLVAHPGDGRDGDNETADVVHEVVLRQWPSLASWIAQERSNLVQLESVRRSANEWTHQGRLEAWLYHLGGRLSEADELLRRRDFAAVVTPILIDYLAACRALQAQRVDEEQRRLLREKEQVRRTRRFQTLAGVFLALVGLIVVATGYRAIRITSIENQRASIILADLSEQAANNGNYDLAARYAVIGIRGYDAPLIGFDASSSENALRRAIDAMRLRLRLVGHRDIVVQASFSRDGNLAETASADGVARIWNARTGQLVRALPGHNGWVMFGQFSRDGARLLTASDDGAARIWSVSDGREVLRLRADADAEFNSAEFSKNGSRIVTAQSNNRATIWDASSGRRLLDLNGHTGSVLEATFSPNDTRVATASRDHTARLWDAASGRELRRFEGHVGTVASLAFSPQGERLVTASTDNSARIWEVSSGRQIAVLQGHSGSVASVRFSNSGALIATAGQDGTARIWNAASGRELARYRINSGPLNSINFSTDDASIIVGASDNSASIWSLDPTVVFTSPDTLYSAIPAHAGRNILVASSDGMAHVIDPASGAQVAATGSREHPVIAAVFAPGDGEVVTGSTDHLARLWSVDDGRELARFVGHASEISSVAISADGAKVITASQDGTARIWDRRSGRQLGVLHQSSTEATDADFSSDGALAVTVGGDNLIRVWNASTFQEIYQLAGHTEAVNDAHFSHDGNRLVSAGSDGTARIWDLRSRRQILVLSGHRSQVNFAIWSPDDTRVVTGSDDLTVRVWDARSGRELLRFEDYTQPVVFGAFTLNGTSIITTSKDRAVRIRPILDSDAVRYASLSPRDLLTTVCATRLINGLQNLNATQWETARHLMPNASRNVCTETSALARIGDLLGLSFGSL